MAWPWISRARHEREVAELRAKLDAAEKRARRRERRTVSTETVGGPSNLVRVNLNGVGKPVPPAYPETESAINDVAMGNPKLVRHLRQFAAAQRALEQTDSAIAHMIRRGATVT